MRRAALALLALAFFQPTGAAQHATLVFYRSKRFYGSKLKPSVYIDGKQVARLANGRYFSIHVSPGPHELESSMRHRSPVPADAKPGSTKYFEMEILSGTWRGGGRLVPAEESAAKEAMRGLKPLDAKWIYGSGASTESETEPGGAPTQNAAAGPRAASMGQASPPAPKVSQTQSRVTVQFNSTPPGADITVDGKYVGDTPSTIELAPGDHSVVIVKVGYQEYRRTLTCTPGGKVVVDAALEKNP